MGDIMKKKSKKNKLKVKNTPEEVVVTETLGQNKNKDQS